MLWFRHGIFVPLEGDKTDCTHKMYFTRTLYPMDVVIDTSAAKQPESILAHTIRDPGTGAEYKLEQIR